MSSFVNWNIIRDKAAITRTVKRCQPDSNVRMYSTDVSTNWRHVSTVLAQKSIVLV